MLWHLGHLAIAERQGCHHCGSSRLRTIDIFDSLGDILGYESP